MTKPRLLFLVHQFGNLTGVELHTKMLTEALATEYEISVAWPVADVPSMPGSWGLRLKESDGTERIVLTDPPAWPVTPYSATTTDTALREILKWVQPDIIHIQHFLNWPLGVIDRALESHAKVVVSFHDHYALSPQYALTGKEAPAELISAEHAQFFGQDISPYLRKRREWLRRSLERIHARVTVSPYIERKMRDVFPLEYRQIEYGIRPFAPRPKISSNNLRFGFLGQRVPMKGWDVLVRAFEQTRRQHPHAELHCFCNAPDVVSHGVLFHGAYQPEHIAEICSRIDVGVVPSIFAETYCMVLSELWHGGLPVAASDIGALHDRVTDGVNGLKFTPGDVDQLAQTLSWFVTHEDWHSWQLLPPRLMPEMAADYDALYRELLTTSRHSTAATLVTNVSRSDRSQVDDIVILQTCEFSDIGDAVHRMHAPSRSVSKLPNVTVIECDVYHRQLPVLAEQADVLVVHGLDAELLPLIERRRATGRATVFEANDLVDDVHAWNPMAHVARDRSLKDVYRHFLKLADGIQTTTHELARRLRALTDRPIAVFPNQLEDIPPLRDRNASRLTIGWAGSPGHFADWYELVPALEEWLLRHPQVQLAVMSGELARSFVTKLPPERYHFEQFGSLADYFRFLDQLDIGLAPLLPTDYNRCRSDVKFLEYASRGVVGVYADLEPYHDSVEHERTGFLYRTSAELFAALNHLVTDAELRKQVRQQAWNHVNDQRRSHQHAHERVAFYRELLSKLRSNTLSSSSGPEVNRWKRTLPCHLQLTREHPEQILSQAIASPASQESAAALTRLVEQYPDYRIAAQQLGRIWNDLNNPQAAIQVFQNATIPTTRMLCEHARSHFLLGQLVPARELLNRAIECNPYDSLAWQYWLRLHLAALRTHRGKVDTTIQALANRAIELHPGNHTLALLAIKLFSPTEQILRIRRLLTDFTPTLAIDEIPAIAATFSESIASIVATQLDQPDVLELLIEAVRCFPQSIRLSSLTAAAYFQAGRHAESQFEYQRSQELSRAAACYRAEFPQHDPFATQRQIAEHVSRFGVPAAPNQ